MQQISMMLQLMDGLSLQSLLRTRISILVLHLLLMHFCKGQSRLIGLTHPIVARVGDDIILPCHLEPAVDVFAETLEWRRLDLDIFVHVRRSGQEFVKVKSPSYRGRTSLFIEELKRGNISLKLSQVKLSDKGTYKCYIPKMEKQSSVELVVALDAAALPVIRLAGIDRDRGGVVLRCDSKGWYPEPEVFWLDGEGNFLSAGPTETVRGPDDLYTVSSRVTVEKRHSNNFTCRVEQSKTNQTRETHFIVPDDFLNVQSSSSPAITSLAVGLALCIVFIVAVLVFLGWKWRQDKSNKMNNTVKSERGQNGNDTELQALSTKQKEGEEPLTTPTVLKKNKGGKKTTKNTLNQQLQEEQQKRKEAENRLKTMEQELENMKKVENNHTELQELHEVHQKTEEDLQALKEKIETKNKELLRIRNRQLFFPWGLSKEDPKKKEQAEKEVEKLKEEVETKEMELKATIEQIEEKQAEFQKLCDDVGMTKNNLPRLLEKLRTSKKDVYVCTLIFLFLLR